MTAIRSPTAGRSSVALAQVSPRAWPRRVTPITPPVAIMALEGMQSHRLAEPPMMSRSTRVTSAPRRAAWVAAWIPAGPPPMITKRTGTTPRYRSRRLLPGGLVHAERLAEHVAHLAQGGPGAQSLLHGHEEVLGAPCGGRHVGQRRLGPGLGPLRPHP